MVNQSHSAALTHHSSSIYILHIRALPYTYSISERATSVPGPKGLRGRRPHSNCVSSNRVQQLSQSVCIGVTLSFGWLGKLSREAANRVRFEPRATFELRATSVPGPKGLRGRRPHSNCVSSNRVQQLSQSVCIGVTLSFGT